MKTKSVLHAVLLTTAVAPVVFSAEPVASVSSADAAASPVAAAPSVEVVYVNPEKFTDVKDSHMAMDRDRDNYLTLLKEFLVERGAKVIPEGSKLTITITDIDMAGDFEPWRGAQFNDVRIVKDMYPPKIDIAYKLTDATGAVLKEGKERLLDLNFQMNLSPVFFSSDSLRHEKNLLDNWLRDQFPKPKDKDAKAKK